jgi:hypothetical protein
VLALSKEVSPPELVFRIELPAVLEFRNWRFPPLLVVKVAPFDELLTTPVPVILKTLLVARLKE